MPIKSRRSSKELTIKSSETRIAAGILVLIISVACIMSSFVDGASFLSTIATWTGKASIIWGILFAFIALRLITRSDIFKSTKFLAGATILAFCLSTLLTFFIPTEELNISSTFANAGGIIGVSIHTYLLDTMGSLLEFLLIIFVSTIGLTLITNITLEQITGFFVSIFTGIFGIFNKASKESSLVASEDNFQSKMIKNPASKGEKQLEFVETRTSLLDTILGRKGKDNETEDHLKDSDHDINGHEHDASMTDGRQSAHDHEQEYIGNQSKPTGKTESQTNKDDASDGENLFTEPLYPNWKYPSSTIFKEPIYKPQDAESHKKNADVIEKTLRSFGIESKIVNIAVGPTVVQYALSITIGTKVAKVKNLSNDLALALASSSSSVRIEAPIPGTSLIGIEIPNPTPNFVYVRELLSDLEKAKNKYSLPIVLGKSVSGQRIIKDLTEMPHLLVAGATGTGKSVGINSILAGLLSTKSPDELRLMLVDPKMVEMAPYNGIPHLLIPVITDMELVINALQWSIEEMMRRYRIFKQVEVRKLKEYNQKMGYNALPYIVIVIDEMADLMLSTGVDVESKIVRLTQMSRAVGIHLILATQRPSVDVITGLIKANVPTRISFAVSTQVDSRVIIDQPGAETLIGKGDMLFKSPEYPRPIRIQDAWTDTQDILKLVQFIKNQSDEVVYYDDITKPRATEKKEKENNSNPNDFSEDNLFEDALSVIINAQKASISLLQRKLRIGYNRAARLMDELEEAGAVGGADGSNLRKVLVSSPSQILNKKETAENSNFDPGKGTDFADELEGYVDPDEGARF